MNNGNYKIKNVSNSKSYTELCQALINWPNLIFVPALVCFRTCASFWDRLTVYIFFVFKKGGNPLVTRYWKQINSSWHNIINKYFLFFVEQRTLNNVTYGFMHFHLNKNDSHPLLWTLHHKAFYHSAYINEVIMAT